MALVAERTVVMHVREIRQPTGRGRETVDGALVHQDAPRCPDRLRRNVDRFGEADLRWRDLWRSTTRGRGVWYQP